MMQAWGCLGVARWAPLRWLHNRSAYDCDGECVLGRAWRLLLCLDACICVAACLVAGYAVAMQDRAPWPPLH